MPAEVKLTDEMKLRILELRMSSKSGRHIAKVLGVSHTTVYDFLSTLPQADLGKEPKCIYDRETVMSIFKLYVEEDKEPRQIAKMLGLRQPDVVSLFAFVRQFKRTARSEVYPNVAAWMNRCGCTIQQMADKLEIDYGELSKILAGKEHMRLNLAEKIKRLTGLTITEIYQVQMQLAPATGDEK